MDGIIALTRYIRNWYRYAVIKSEGRISQYKRRRKWQCDITVCSRHRLSYCGLDIHGLGYAPLEYLCEHANKTLCSIESKNSLYQIRKIQFIKETVLQRVQLTQEATNTILHSISECYHKIHEIWIWRNEEGRNHGLLGGVTHDLPENIEQNCTIFPSVCSILRKDLIKNKSYAWSKVKT